MQAAVKPQIAEKAHVIEQAQEKFGRATGVFFTEYRGLKVKEMQALRKDLKAKGGEITVIKNTLFYRALGDDAGKLTDDLTSGPTAVTFVYENEAECAKVLMDFAKVNKKFVVKGGLLEGKVFDAAGVDALSKLPPREVLIAQVIGAIAAPLSNLVGVIEALYADPIRVIGAVADKVAEEAPAPKAEAAPAQAETAPEAPAETVETESSEPATAPEAEATTEDAPAENAGDSTTE
ncbi:50S ribosomal protein L10 [Kamptonema cortianum]|nr:50S ribosomal protein L10 [Geitlerinema splendidum]MDK3161085.1 50S ribosomal protein L10 [Kamptonema cortianum]